MEQPKIPTLKDAQKPQVKIKGLGAGLTLIDRLKQFKKKDLAFILAGLGTLFMAPLAEHFMMAPESGDSSLQKGWGGGGSGGANIFGNGSSPYENGNNSIAQGGAIGGSGDIITPLNVRDPSALVMGPGGTQQPPAGSIAPSTPPPPTTTAPSRSETDYKDALAGAASRAGSAALKKSPLPVPKVALGGSGLRGLGVAGGGSSAASGSLGPINSGNLGSAGTGGGGLNLVRSNPNFRGAAGPRSPTGSNLDGTKRAGANAGDAFTRAGSALGGLTSAASEQIPTGGGGAGGSGAGGAATADKAGGGNGPDGTKSTGESLAFLEAKERMMENLKLEFEKRKLNDAGLLWANIRNDSLKAMASEMTKGLTKGMMGLFDGSKAGSGENYYICGAAGSAIRVAIDTPKCAAAPANVGCMATGGNNSYIPPEGGTALQCTKFGSGDASAASKTEGGIATTAPGGITAGTPDSAEATNNAKLEGYCLLMRTQVSEEKKPGVTATNAATILQTLDTLVAARIALYRNGENTCTDKNTKIPSFGDTSVAGFIKKGIEKMDGETTGTGVLKSALDFVPKKDEADLNDKVQEALDEFNNGEKLRVKINEAIKGITAADLKINSNESGEAGRLREAAEKTLTNLQGRAGETGATSAKILLKSLIDLTGSDGLMLATHKAHGSLNKVTKTNEKYASASEGQPNAAITGKLPTTPFTPSGATDPVGAPGASTPDPRWKDAKEQILRMTTEAEGPINDLKSAQEEQKQALVEPAKQKVVAAQGAQADMITGIQSSVQALRKRGGSGSTGAVPTAP